MNWPPDPPEEPAMSREREELWALLENASVPMYLIELADRVVESLEWAADRECPTCQAMALEEEARIAREIRG
jgi:hypothetical protein